MAGSFRFFLCAHVLFLSVLFFLSLFELYILIERGKKEGAGLLFSLLFFLAL